MLNLGSLKINRAIGVSSFLILWAVLFSIIHIFWEKNPQYGYGWSVPFIAAYFLLQRWQTRPVRSAISVPSKIQKTLILALVAALIPFKVILEVNLDWRLVIWMTALLVLTITCLALFASGGKPWLFHFCFPFLFLLVSVPWLNSFETAVTQNLMRWVAWLTVEFLGLMQIPVIQHGNLIETSLGVVGVNEACSGIRSLQSTVMVALFLGEIYAFSFGRRVLFLGAGAFISFLCNLGRALFLTYVASQGGGQRVEKYHDSAGLIVFVITTILLWLLAKWFSRGSPPVSSPKNRPEEDMLIHPSLGLTILISSSLVLCCSQLWFWVNRVESASALEWKVEPPTQALNYKEIPIIPEVKEMLAFDSGICMDWDQNQTHWTLFFFRWNPQEDVAYLVKDHRPEICLTASGSKLKSDLGLRTMNLGSLQIPYRAYVFEHSQKPIYVYYFLWRGLKLNDLTVMHLNNEYSLRGRLKLALAGQRNQVQQVVEIVLQGSATEDLARKDLEETLTKIVKIER